MTDYQGKRFRKQPDGNAPQRESTSAGSHAARGHGARPATTPRIEPVRSGGRSSASRHTGSARAGSNPAASARIAPVHAGTASGKDPRGGHGDRGKPKRRKRAVLPIILIGVGILLLGVAGFLFISMQLGYQQAVETYDRYAQYVTIDDSDGRGIPDVDFDALRAENEDIVAWLYIPNTNINYPVVQGDDNEWYLNHLFDGTWNVSGTIFQDYEQTAPGMVDQQTTLYGHHMNNWTMFYEIDESTDQTQFDEIEVAYYITPDTVYCLKPLATSVVDDAYVEARQPSFGGDNSLANYLADVVSKASAKADDADTRAATAEQVLTLVTCNYSWDVKARAIMVLTLEETIPQTQGQTAADEAA